MPALNWRSMAPVIVILLLVSIPLVVWAASSGGDKKGLLVERGTNFTGRPELVVSLAEKDLNTLETTNGDTFVRVQCFDRNGEVLLDQRQNWPLIEEAGFDYPHVHQIVSPEQLQKADRCRLRGTRVRLEADVKGAFPSGY